MGGGGEVGMWGGKWGGGEVVSDNSQPFSSLRLTIVGSAAMN